MRSPVGETSWRSRFTATPPGSARTSTGRAREDPALHLGHIGQGREGLVGRHGLERVGQRRGEDARRARGARPGARRGPGAPRPRPAAAPPAWPRTRSRTGARGRASGRRRARSPRAGRARVPAGRARPPARGRSPPRSSRDRARPGPAPLVPYRLRGPAPGRARPRPPARATASRSAAYEAHSTSCQAAVAPLTRTTSPPARGGPAGRAARAAPCRWAARTGAGRRRPPPRHPANARGPGPPRSRPRSPRT